MKKAAGRKRVKIAAFSYSLGYFSGVLAYILWKKDKFVRFHAAQSTVWFLLLVIANAILQSISKQSIIGGFYRFIDVGLIVVAIGSWIYLMIQALRGSEYRLPIIGEIIYKFVNRKQ